MRAIVLVGGQGTRLRPLTYSVPKPMLPVAGKPMIAHTIEWLGRHGIDEVVFSLGYRPDAFTTAFPDAVWAGVKLVYAVEPEPLDTAGAIRFAAAAVGALNERLVVVNGDILTDLDVTALVAFHDRSGAEGTIHLTPVADPSAYGVVPTERDGRVLEFIEKPPPGTAPTNFINGGTYVLEGAALARIDSGHSVSIERQIFPEMVADRVLYALADSTYWIDTGTPRTYISAQLDVLAGRRPDVVLPSHHDLATGIHVGELAQLDGKVVTPALIGAGAVVHARATICNSVLGDRAVVEPGASVEGSIVLDGAVIRADAIVKDSIIGFDARIGARAMILEHSIVGCGVEVEPGARHSGARLPE